MADAPLRSAIGIGASPAGIDATEWLRVAARASRFVFRGDADARTTAGATFGISLPILTGRAVTRGARAVLALGPDEYLFIVPEDEAATFQAALGAALRDLPHSLVDVSHARVALDLCGPHAEWLLAAACPLPLDRETFPVDACTRTVFAKAAIQLWRIAPDVFRIEVARSYCRYVVDLLVEVARELPADAGRVS
jgi:sarcosine oxidase subunit gamma